MSEIVDEYEDEKEKIIEYFENELFFGKKLSSLTLEEIMIALYLKQLEVDHYRSTLHNYVDTINSLNKKLI